MGIRKLYITLFMILMCASAIGCAKLTDATDSTSIASVPEITVSLSEKEAKTAEVSDTEQSAAEISDTITEPKEIGEAGEKMIMTIGDTQVPVIWEDNASVTELSALAQDELKIDMSMYGGFEQVGSIGQDIAGDDRQTTTSAGDIVLYSGNQLVVFYGSNSWAYTRLGKIDLSQEELTELLSNGDVTITIKTD